jgi:hypothetical protein
MRGSAVGSVPALRVSEPGLRSRPLGELLHRLARLAQAVLDGFPHNVAEDAVNLSCVLEPGLVLGTVPIEGDRLHARSSPILHTRSGVSRHPRGALTVTCR